MFHPIILQPDQKVTEPGLYIMSMDQYHSDCCDGPSISSSGLRTIFSKSPAHFFSDSYYNPNRREQKTKEHFILGRAAHHLFLGEKDFRKHFVMQPEHSPDGKPWSGNNLTAKKWLAEKELNGILVLSAKMAEQIKGMAKAIQEHPFARHLLTGEIEMTLIFRDPETGIWIKVRPDVIPNFSGDYSDLKTTESVMPDDISRTLGDYRYDMQATLVGQASKRVLNLDMQSFTLIFIEKSEPFCIEPTTITSQDLDAAWLDAKAAIKTFARCMETGVWPGPGGTQNDGVYRSVPDWARRKADFRRKFLEQELSA